MVLPVSPGLAGALTEQALGLLLDLVMEQSRGPRIASTRTSLLLRRRRRLSVVSEYARYEPRHDGRTRDAPMLLAIRAAARADAQVLAEILSRREGGGDVDAMRERFERLAAAEDGLLLVAEVHGRVVGYGRVMHHAGSMGCRVGI